MRVRVPVVVWQPCELLYTCYLLTYFLHLHRDTTGIKGIPCDETVRDATLRVLAVASFCGIPCARRLKLQTGELNGASLMGPLRYDTRCYFNARSKADTSRLNLPRGFSANDRMK